MNIIGFKDWSPCPGSLGTLLSPDWRAIATLMPDCMVAIVRIRRAASGTYEWKTASATVIRMNKSAWKFHVLFERPDDAYELFMLVRAHAIAPAVPFSDSLCEKFPAYRQAGPAASVV